MNLFNSNSISSATQPLTFFLKFNFFFGNLAFISLFIAVLLYWFDFFDTRQLSKKLKNFCMVGANISLAFLLIFRWYESGHFPLSNLYESLIGLSWCFTSIHLILVLNPLEFLSNIIRNPKDRRRHQSWNALTFKQPIQNKKISVESQSEIFPKEENYSLSSSLVLTLGSPESKINLKQNDVINKEANFTLAKGNDKIGAITAPTALLTSVFATFFLPPEITQASALIPALKSNWLTMHVTVMVASYAFLLIGSLLSITYCVFRLASQFIKKENQEEVLQSDFNNVPAFNLETRNFEKTFFNTKNLINYNSKTPGLTEFSMHSDHQKTLNISTAKKESFLFRPLYNNSFNFAGWLNTTSYRILGLGFPLLTIGILSGAVWANEAWGSYWSWDPKETWALITWLVFAVYFHSRYTRSADSFIPATIASIGFVVIWICYLGVNLLGTGLHSYGWFSS